MITLTSDTSVALLVVLMKQNYGKAWYSLDGDLIVAGIHAPTGEVSYKIPAKYKDYLKGAIELENSDVLTTAFGGDSAERLLEWSKSL